MVRDNFWKLYDPEALKLRGELPELTVCRAKPMALFVQGMWSAGWLELKKTKNFTSFRAASPTEPRH